MLLDGSGRADSRTGQLFTQDVYEILYRRSEEEKDSCQGTLPSHCT